MRPLSSESVGGRCQVLAKIPAICSILACVTTIWPGFAASVSVEGAVSDKDQEREREEVNQRLSKQFLQHCPTFPPRAPFGGDVWPYGVYQMGDV